MTEFEFQGTIHLGLRRMHDAIAETWLSADGLNSGEEMRDLLALTDGQLTCGAIQGFGLHAIPSFNPQELCSAFLRLRREFKQRFPAAHVTTCFAPARESF